ncbi:MAG: hypothetical protein Q9159_007719 [Coniocarpon cinnabarinum]
MRLDEGVIRELHWHKEAEWAYVLEGNVRVTALDVAGGSFVDDLEKGDLWYFPAGFPHSLQGLSPNGTEFLLIFDDGRFSEDSTFLLTDLLAHMPKSVISENFRLPPEVFDTLPQHEKYIFQGDLPGDIDEEVPAGKGVKKSKLQFTHKMMAQKPENATGGQVRITDSRNFPISKTVAAAHLDIEPGAMREMHWHPNADEWSFFIRGRARVTIFAAEGNARTFDYMAGDVGESPTPPPSRIEPNVLSSASNTLPSRPSPFQNPQASPSAFTTVQDQRLALTEVGVVPRNNGHFIENLSDDEPLEVLEIFRADEFQDFSLFQWLGETPQRLVKDHLFRENPRAAKKLEESLRGAEKDVIKRKMGRDEGLDEEGREL